MNRPLGVHKTSAFDVAAVAGKGRTVGELGAMATYVKPNGRSCSCIVLFRLFRAGVLSKLVLVDGSSPRGGGGPRTETKQHCFRSGSRCRFVTMLDC